MEPVNLQKGTRYALYAASALARGYADDVVTVAQVAAKNDLPQAIVAKVFQQLVRAGLAVGTRGSSGGYRLARAPHAVTVLDVIDAFEPRRPEGTCLLHDRPLARCREENGADVRRVIDEVDEMARCTFASITLETMVGGKGATGRVAARTPTRPPRPSAAR